MFGKKNKEAEPFTPLDLDKLSQESRDFINHGGTRREAAQLTKDEKRKRTARWLILVIILVIIILWLLARWATQYGDLVVSMDRELATKGLVLSETEDFKETEFVLSGENAVDVYHFTYDWFESKGVLDDLDNIDGSHNGDDYFAYTFYMKNTSDETFDYTGSLTVTGSSKGCEEAARIMVYKNGEPNIYSKPQYGTDVPELDATAFVDDDTVCVTQGNDFAPGAVDKYTVVIWFEGKDSECINDIMGGHMRLSMLFEAAELEGATE